MHKEIINTRHGVREWEIYTVQAARKSFHKIEYSAHELSVMKQENISNALGQGYDLNTIKNALKTHCGYCF